MSVTVSPPVRVLALVGILAAAGLAAFMLLAGRSAGDAEPSASPARAEGAPVTPKATPSRPRTPAQTTPRPTKSGFPPFVDRALRRKGVAVIMVYMPRAAVDAVVRAEARAGATRARAGFIAVSALQERLVRGIVAKTGVLPQPAVVVVGRSGAVTATLSVTDRDTVAQAVAQAR